ncbi:MAG: hypothetical protein K0Q79_589 [Flavipsychrobacter sp.]|jgi:predicted ATPase|nr:hypothetical protein [Flavipsychrobacter sp.]
MEKVVESISIANYRGFKEEQFFDLADNNSITFLVGQNNSGKSLIAKALSLVNRIDNIKFGFGDDLNDYDFHNLSIDIPFKITLTFTKKHTDSIYTQLDQIYNSIKDSIRKCQLVYLFYKNPGGSVQCNCFVTLDNIEPYKYKGGKFSYTKDFLTKINAIESGLNNVADFFRKSIVNSFLIFAPIRSFGLSNDKAMTGKDILNWLEDSKHASIVTVAKRKIGEYLQRLNLEDPLAVKAEPNLLSFTFKNHLKLTSDDIGTGYTMIYILLMEIMRNKKKVVIIDEIESHLQPGLIRELIKIIREIGGEQYVISTHSPTVMESATENDCLYHFQKKGDACYINKFYRNNTDAKILRTVANDLGVIPGDALLSNCVIWVEGPSEIMWLRAWMKAYLPIYIEKANYQFNLLEGLHYSILMTGGGLIANISFDEQTNCIEDIEDDFALKVLRVNPNPFVMVDSDNNSKIKRCIRIAGELNDQNKTATWFSHIKEEITESNIHHVANFWLLKGRELENYCHPELLKQFYTKRSEHGNSKIKGVTESIKWDVFSEQYGVGSMLSKQDVTGVCDSSGTILHKDALAKFVFQKFNKSHFEDNPKNMEKPNQKMLQDLMGNLHKLFEYIRLVNSLN